MALKLSKTAAASIVDELSGSVASSGTYTVAKEAEKSTYQYVNVVVEKSTDNTTFSTATLGADYDFDIVTGILTNITAGALYYRIDYTYHDVISINLATTDPAYNALTSQHPLSGSSVEIRAFLFNDNIDKYYTDITIDPTDSVDTDESGWLQMAEDVSGSAGTYLAGSEALIMSNIGSSTGGDTSDYPFWVKITSPTVTETQNKSDIKLTTNFTEFAV
jgi:hypothetical protein